VYLPKVIWRKVFSCNQQSWSTLMCEDSERVWRENSHKAMRPSSFVPPTRHGILGNMFICSACLGCLGNCLAELGRNLSTTGP
jgi:hypothetical protein